MNAGAGGGSELDGLLERELGQRLGDVHGPSPAVSQTAYHAFAGGGNRMLLIHKAAIGIAAAAFAVAGGAVAASAATGSTDPSVWGKTVTNAVTTCKDNLKDGQHGIGQCVSAVAKTHGPAERAQHSRASKARTDEPEGKPDDAPGGKPAGTPGGRPTDVPHGPPSRH